MFIAGTNTDSYNRYTFYRLLSELGTDTAADAPGDKMNLNYDNLVQTNRMTYVRSTTNFIPWRPIDFFTNAASRLLANAGYDAKSVSNPGLRLSINHIPIWPNNLYTPSVQRLLQVAANVYDATTNRVLNLAKPAPGYPTVLRPVFGKEPDRGLVTNIFIKGFEEVVDAAPFVNRSIPMRDLSVQDDRDKLRQNDMVYGVGLIVGAKKGYPNFNEFAAQTLVQVTRKLEFRRPTALSAVNETNQMYTLCISNVFGIEAWNSYSNAYPRRLQMRASVDMFAGLTNEFSQVLLTNTVYRAAPVIDITASNWTGFQSPYFAATSFKIPFPPITNDFYFLTNSTYNATRRQFGFLTGVFERNRGSRLGFPVPHWWLNLRTRMRFILIDTEVSPSRIVDYVNLDSQEEPLDLAQILMTGGNCSGGNNAEPGSMWCTNRFGGPPEDLSKPTYGILNQIAACLGITDPTDWNTVPASLPPHLDKDAAIDFFRYQFDLSPRHYPSTIFNKTNVFYAPFAATRDIYFLTSWQANDPIVHYSIGDLTDLVQSNRIQFDTKFSTITNIGSINGRYEPWGGNPLGSSSSETRKDLAYKDPLVTRSDDWEFPTNKFPNVGWLGRVHRGSPWQTIDLKSQVPTNLLTWAKWSGDGILQRNAGQFMTNVVPLNAVTNDAVFTHPLNDRYILDLFTAAPNDNAARGQLSVNQTNLAAWSAVLGGVNVMPDLATNMFIPPAGVYDPGAPPPLVRIVQGLINARTNYPGNTFHRLGDILITPELTVQSPFLSSRTDLQNDAVYERIPQQILGLLKGSGDPRFVIYSFGQALKPAVRSLVTSGPYAGLCTNYQITAEIATRAVVRIEGTPAYPHPFSAQQPFNNLRAVVESFNVLPPD